MSHSYVVTNGVLPVLLFLLSLKLVLKLSAPALEEALYIMVQSYEALGMTQLRDDTKRVMEKTYPRSNYVARGFKASQGPWWKVW